MRCSRATMTSRPPVAKIAATIHSTNCLRPVIMLPPGMPARGTPFRESDLILSHLAVERIAGDAEEAGGLGAVAFGDAQRLLNRQFLHLLHGKGFFRRR